MEGICDLWLSVLNRAIQDANGKGKELSNHKKGSKYRYHGVHQRSAREFLTGKGNFDFCADALHIKHNLNLTPELIRGMYGSGIDTGRDEAGGTGGRYKRVITGIKSGAKGGSVQKAKSKKLENGLTGERRQGKINLASAGGDIP